MKTVGRVLGRMGLVMLGLALPLLVLEGGTRLMGIAPPAEPQPALWVPHPYLGWFHLPNQGGLTYSEYGEFQAPVHINARGLRDREIGYDNPADAYRILVLGDSFAEALQVPLEETFAKKLEALTTSDSRPVEVINAGVGGWGTDQEATFYMVEGFRYQPDVVILSFFTHNDALNNYQPLETARVHGAVRKPFFHLNDGQLVVPDFPFEAPPEEDRASPPLLAAGNWMNDHSALCRLVRPYLREIPFVLRALGPSGLLGGMAAFMADDPALLPSYFVYRADSLPDWEEAWQLTAVLIQRLDAEVQERGGHLVVVIIGAPEQVYPDRWSAILARHPKMNDYDWDLEAPNRRLTAILDETNIPYLDLLPVFRTVTGQPDAPPLHFRHDGHWTIAGHQLAAEAIASFLKAQDLLDQ